MTTRVMLVDDHRMVREALRDALARQPDLEVVAEAGDARDALAQSALVAPDIVVLDIGLPDLNGMELAARLKKSRPAVGVVALSGYTDKRFVTEMFRSGASAYVIKAAAGTELVRAIRAVVAGEQYLCPEVAGNLVSSIRESARRGESTRLGRREREVLRLVAGGLRSSEIAAELHISIATVEVHRRNIMRKLDLHTIAELTQHAIRDGILTL